MIQITTRVSEVVAKELDEVAVHFNNNRSEVLRQAIDRFLEEVEDASISLDRLKDPDANWLDWDDVKREFQDKDWGTSEKGVEQILELILIMFNQHNYY